VLDDQEEESIRALTEGDRVVGEQITRAIVVGVDESDGAADALRWAAKEADFHQAGLTAVMAWGFLDQHHTIVGERFDPTYGEQAATDALREFVVRALGTERARTVDVRPVCDLPARALLEAGSAADLLVVGARGLGGFRGLLLGSVSQHCLHHTTTPIAIIRPVDAEHETSGRIVVAVDGSPTSHRALQWAMVESRARDVTLDVVHAWQVPYAGYLPFGSTRPDDADAYEDAATQLLERMIASAGGDSDRTRAVPIRGATSEAVLRAAEGADLLVAGTRGHSPLKRLVLGSVATQLVHHARCPLVVVPPDQQARHGRDQRDAVRE
jgi:nucleotide-binding universal stress UspA family protein